MQLASFDKKIIVLLNGLPFIYLPDLHLTYELSKFEVKISFEVLQLSPTPISLKFAATLYPTLVLGLKEHEEKLVVQLKFLGQTWSECH